MVQCFCSELLPPSCAMQYAESFVMMNLPKLLVFCVLGQSPRNYRHPAITLSVVIKSIWAKGASEWQTISQDRSGGDVKTNIRIHLNPILVVFNLIDTVRVTEKKWKMKSLIHQTYLMPDKNYNLQLSVTDVYSVQFCNLLVCVSFLMIH